MGSPPGSAPLHAAAGAFNRGQATDEDEVRPVFESIFVPITVPMATLLRPPVSENFDFVGKAWSEWQDLKLRPPRPERGALQVASWCRRPLWTFRDRVRVVPNFARSLAVNRRRFGN